MLIESTVSISNETKLEIPNSKFPKTITAARFALAANVLPLVTGSLPFAELVRRALIRSRGFDTAHSEAITGKSADGVPLVHHRHAHYLATDEDGDGRIDHLTIYAPGKFCDADVAALNRMNSINWRESRTGVRLILTGLGNAADFAENEKRIALFQKPVKFHSIKFRSVTPFSLPYFPNRGGGKPARPKDAPEGQLRRELRKRGLPEPIAVTAIKGFYEKDRLEKYKSAEKLNEETPRFRWLDFSYRRFNGVAGNGLAGFEIEFAPEDLDKIEVPLALGFGSHFGLGLFLPVI